MNHYAWFNMVKNRFKFLKIYFMFVYVRVGPHEASGQHGAADSFPLLCVVPGNGTQCLGLATNAFTL